MLAIHYRKRSYSDKWIEYCNENKIDYKIVNCYDNDIIEQLNECNALMWHWYHNDIKDILFARQLTLSLELKGIKVFPSSETAWHFDDKIAQKYLLEAINAPLINSYVFYDKEKALNWVNSTSFPKVFKFRSGAGSENVKKISNKNEAKAYIRKIFEKGFVSVDRFHSYKEKVWNFKKQKNLKSFLNISKGLLRIIFRHKNNKALPLVKNYLYAQDFIPNNDCDIRVIVIGDRAFGIKRMVRENDFRASGSGFIVYEKKQIPIECLKIAFDLTKKLNAQCLAFDFIFFNNIPKIIEISYAFNRLVYLDCPGYWDDSFNWVEGNFFPEYFMLEDLLKLEI